MRSILNVTLVMTVTIIAGDKRIRRILATCNQ